MAHRVFVLFLTLITLTAAIAVGARGIGYYLTPTHLRPFRADHETMRPSGNYSHGLGIIGASMIVIGVSTYSSRKRLRALWNLGKLSRWLEVHITLCLLGPILVVFHTTFKAGGVAAISLWTMLSVAASGIIGRFLYVQIPRNIQGTELTTTQIQGEIERLGTMLSSTAVGARLVKSIDEQFALYKRPDTLWQAIAGFFHLQSIRKRVRTQIHRLVPTGTLSRAQARQMYKTAAARALLLQKTFALGQVERLFYYWHAVHLPFTVIMFLTLAAHVTVTVLLGYRWIF